MTEFAGTAVDVLDDLPLSEEKLKLLERARNNAWWYLEKVEEDEPDSLPDAHRLMAHLDRISTCRLSATIFLTNKASDLRPNHVAVTIEYPGEGDPSVERFVVPALARMDGTAPIADFFADPGDDEPGCGIPKDFHAIRGLAVSGGLELAIDYGSPDYYGAYAPND